MRSKNRTKLEKILADHRIKQIDIYNCLFERFEKLKAENSNYQNMDGLTPINRSNLSFLVSGQRWGVSLMTAARIKYAVNVLSGQNYSFDDLFENDRMKFNLKEVS